MREGERHAGCLRAGEKNNRGPDDVSLFELNYFESVHERRSN